MPRPSILVSPNAFKGTLSPSQAARVILRVIRKYHPAYRCDALPLADGGDGTLNVALTVFGGKRMKTTVQGPHGRPVRAQWALLRGRVALIEMARASGLALIRGRNRILDATSFGTGQLIRTALDHGCRDIWIGVGGTATGDGGAGALRALGLKLADRKGNPLAGSPRDLTQLAAVEWDAFDSRLAASRIVVLCDVGNPLLGPNGSARVFGPQKGASAPQVRILERALKQWSHFAPRQTKNRAGAGAAGALAYGLSAFAGARLVKGTAFLMEATRWPSLAKNAAVIITGEGRLDRTSFFGKVVGEILRRKKKSKVAVLTGTCALSPREWKRRGIWKVIEMGASGRKHPRKALAQAARLIWNTG